MNARRNELARAREEIDAEIVRLDRAISIITGAEEKAQTRKPNKNERRRGRPRGTTNEGSLTDMITRVLSTTSRDLSPAEIAVLVQRAGYKSRAKDLAKAVCNALYKMEEVERVCFALYRM